MGTTNVAATAVYNQVPVSEEVSQAPSNSATADLIRDQYQNPRIRYVREDRPGLSYARNAGVQEARYDYIAFTDDAST